MKCYKAATKVVKTLSSNGFTAFFAGGWVRDHLLGKDADDIDIATSATPEQVMSLFEKTIPVGINFSILIVVQDDIHFEVATFRTESDYEDGRRPNIVTHASPEEDAKRRDFTINGMFYDPLKKKVYDFVGGEKDLKAQIIRAIGDPHHRFAEDRLRMIRACRYSARFGFNIDKSTKEAIKAHAPELFPAVAIERVYDEFKKMTREHHLFDAALLMYEFGLMHQIFKDFNLCDFETLKKHLSSLDQYPDETPPIIFLFEMIEKPTLREKLSLCQYFKVASKEIKYTEELEKWLDSTSLKDHQLADLYAHPMHDTSLKIAAIHAKEKDFIPFHKKKQKKLKKHVQRKIDKAPLITSKDLLDKGMKASKELGNMLKKAEEIAINENLSTKNEVLNRLEFENN